jgi:dGTPase
MRLPRRKKVGFFGSEQSYFTEIADKLDLKRRDQNEEDGYELGYLHFREARDVLAAIAGDRAELSSSMEEREQIAKLRAVAIGQLVDECSAVFLDNESSVLAGEFSSEIVDLTKFATDLGRAKALAADKLYNSERKIKLEIAGVEIIDGLLDIFSEVVTDLTNADFDRSKLSARSQRLARLMDISLGPVEDSYQVVSGMTDRYAVETYRTLKGIAL